jgi:hypothetical protein
MCEPFTATFSISQTKERGRIVIANKNFNTGDIIYSEHPIILFNSDQNSNLITAIDLEAICEQVNSQIASMTAKLDLPDISIDPKSLDVALQFIKEPTSVKNKVLNLHKPPDNDTVQSAYNWFRLGAMLLMESIKEHVPLTQQVDQHLFMDVMMIAYVNAFKTRDNNGGALYEISCLVNHSCRPNCFYTQDHENRITVRASRSIQEGDEINFSYISDSILVKPIPMRRDRLATYHFVCNCERCTTPLDDTRKFICQQCQAEIPSNMMCPTCCKNNTNILAQIEKKVQDKVRELERDFDNLFDDSGIAETLEQCRNKLSNHHWCVAKLHEMMHDFHWQDFQARLKSIDQFSKQELETICTKMIEHMEVKEEYLESLLDNSYTVAQCYEALGDYYAYFWISEKKENIVKLFKKACHIFQVLLGNDHEEVNAVMEKIRKLE